MMKDQKTEFRIFTISQYRQEEEYLTKMHEQGWKFRRVDFPGFYRFDKCQPEQVSYRLDFNLEGLKNKGEYEKMFEDCGWEPIQDFMGYSYFRKAGQAGEEKEEIFCDDDSRLEMMNRVFRGKMIPLIIIFLACLVPQFVSNMWGYGNHGNFGYLVTVALLVVSIMYLVTFAVMTVQFYQYEKNAKGESSELKLKYCGIAAILTLFVVGIGFVIWASSRSVYDFTEVDSGYVVEAERLNSVVSVDYDLKAGDTVYYHIDHTGGEISLNLEEQGEDPVYYGNFYESGDHIYEIQQDGSYSVEVSGKNGNGTITVSIQ